MNTKPSLLGAIVTVAVCAMTASSPARAQSRGELLYSTHCIACHTSQMHWRDARVATDWATLAFQVRRWQGAAALGWSEADVIEVADYLNDSIYRFERAPGPLSSLGMPQAQQGR